ncbi:MAG TPA: amidohydrolase family protein [Dermatophilaceae bacterium]|nr:amidohydrolase family protein [Dermatophilaceae bacterium]
MSLVLRGTVVSFDGDPINDGAVYVHDGIIESVQRRSAAAPTGFADAPVVDTGGVIYPGLIDLHNHLAYNTLPLWTAPRSAPYQTRYQWPGAATYGRDISNPAQALGIAAAAATLRYAEVRAAVGGVTAIQGSPPLTRAFPGWMVRNVEKEEFPSRPGQLMYQAVIKPEPDKLATYAARLADRRSFVYHLAEGVAASLLSEFDELDRAGCLQPGLIGVHSTALGATQYERWGQSPGTVVWSPFSNIWLYGDTTDVLEARRHGLLVTLGSDWGPSGTRNLLGELKVAQLWNQEALGGALSDADLAAMVTVNPGQALRRCWDLDVGVLRPGALADMVVLHRRHDEVHRNLVSALERDVRLVVVGGRPVYGQTSLMRRAGAADLEPIVVSGQRRSIVMRLPDDLVPHDPVLAAEATQSWAAGLAVLQAVVDDPAAAVRRARERRAVPGAEPLEFEPDMPAAEGDGARALDDDELDELVMPPLQPLAHDDAWFDVVEAGHPHAAVLRGLRALFG